MRKKMICLFLCVFLMMGMVLTVWAEEAEQPDEIVEEAVWRELTISTTEDFLKFAENCRLDTYSKNLKVVLQADIDLTDRAFSGVPIFSGTFDGKKHKITGLNITGDGSMQGLFRYLTDTAVVQDLTVSGMIQPGGSKNEIGAIAGRNEGKIRNCDFSGTLSGNDYVGGIAGTNGVTGVIDHCGTDGMIHGNHFVGGIAGENSGVIRNCENMAPVNTTPQQNTIEISDITLDTLTNTETVNTVTDIGGIAGISSGVIRSCENRADVGYRNMGYNIGGITGTQMGYLTQCQNYGNIHGRKEVGGIVGQMEPVSRIEYTEDALQILQGQLNTMSGLVTQASGNAQANAGTITTQLGALKDQAETARDAVDTMIPDPEDPELPDPDTILAAQNTLSSILDSMPDTLTGISAATQTTVYNLNRDLNAISAQIGVMSQTLNQASENMGGTISDVSDQDTPEQLTAKVEDCANYGDVLADLNVGGIAGAMAVENDLDITEDWLEDGDSSMNFHAQLRAVILNCNNSGTVTGNKQNAGGITGWQSMGLVKDSGNTGRIDSENASYVGGISGMSTGYIRTSCASCDISGKSCVGGIAGSATVVTDSVAKVRLIGGAEKLGAVLGCREEPGTQTEDPVLGNLYLRMDRDYGAIDGISYSGLAEGMDLEEFLALETLPDMFRSVTVDFLFADGTQERITLRPGDSLPEDKIPVIPEKSGFTEKWDGLEDAQLDSILCNLSFEAVYIPYSTTIHSQQTRENGRPILLAEGAFTEDAALSPEESSAAPALTEKETMVESWMVQIPDGAEKIRFLLPESTDAQNWKLLLQDAAGIWNETEFVQDGSYLVFPAEPGSVNLALVQAQNDYSLLIIAGVSAVLVIAAIGVGLCIRRNRRTKVPVRTDSDSE